MADLILTGGHIVTMDAKMPVASALAVKGDRIMAVGSNRDISKLAYSGTDIIEVDDLVVIPGFNDTHAHMDREGLKIQRPSIDGVKSIGELLERIKAIVQETPKGEWIVTMPIGDAPFYFRGLESLKEKRMPNRLELDQVAPENPVCISGVFANWGEPPGYTALNTKALEINGIGIDTNPDCEGISIERDSNGDPTGVIVEYNQRPFIEFDLLPNIPRFGFADRIKGIQTSMALYNAVGTTSVYEGHGLGSETISAYRELWEKNQLSVRIGLTLSPSWKDIREAKYIMRDWLGYARGRGVGDPWLWISGVHIAYGGDKIVAELARKDLPNTGWSGFIEQAVTQHEYRDYCMAAAEHDLRVHTIVGDDLPNLIPILTEISNKFPIDKRRWVVEHVGRARYEDLKCLKALGVQVTTIPAYYIWKNSDSYSQDPDEGNYIVPHRTMLDLMIPVAAGTDNIPYNPLFSLWVMTERRERLRNSILGPSQRITGYEALDLMTTQGARLTFEEKNKGRITTGYYADLAILSDNPVIIDPKKLRGIKCKMTIVGGTIVYNDL